MPQDLHSKFENLLGTAEPDEARVKLIREITVRLWKQEKAALLKKRALLQKEFDDLGEHKISIAEKVVAGYITLSE